MNLVEGAPKGPPVLSADLARERARRLGLLFGLLVDRRTEAILEDWRKHPEAPMFVHLNYRRDSRSDQK